MAGGRVRGNDLRAAPVAGAGGDAASDSVSDPRLSLRQRQSEFINHQVAGLLEKLRVEFTKSRAYRTTDNALVEGKNGAVIRKHIGYGPIAAEHAEAFQKFFTALSESVSEFPPALRICHHPDRVARSAQADLSSRRLPNALRETDLAAEMGEFPEARPGRRAVTAHLPTDCRTPKPLEKCRTQNSLCWPSVARLEVIRCDSAVRRLSQVTACWAKGRGLNRRPLPLDPFPGSPPANF